MSSPSQSSKGWLLSGSSAASSSNVQRRSFGCFAAGLGLVAITVKIKHQLHRQSRLGSKMLRRLLLSNQFRVFLLNQRFVAVDVVREDQGGIGSGRIFLGNAHAVEGAIDKN